jgi:uncharacterized RDD family membrane protein YckC
MYPGPFRRLGAIFYDALLVSAALFVVTALFLPFTGGEAITSGSLWVRIAWRIVLLATVVGYFGLSWTTQGQTLGMKVWRLVLVRADEGVVSWRDVVIRLAWACVPWLPGLLTIAIAERDVVPTTLRPLGVALFGLVPLNYLAAYFDRQRRAWHERRLPTKIMQAQLGKV